MALFLAFLFVTYVLPLIILRPIGLPDFPAGEPTVRIARMLAHG